MKNTNKKEYTLYIHKNIWHVSFRIPDNDGNMKQKCLSTGIKGEKGTDLNKAEADRQAFRIYMERCQKPVTNDKILLCDYIAEYLERKKLTKAPTTYTNDKHYLIKHIYPYFKKKKLKLKDVKPKHIEQYWMDKVAEGLQKNTTLKHIHLISPALNDAVKNGYILTNPCNYADKPKKEKPQHNIYTAAELAKLLEISQGTNMELPIYLAVNFALRREEVLGLMWSDIDFDEKVMHIRHTCTRAKINGKMMVVRAERTKTDASRADFPLNDEVIAYLKQVKEKQMQLPRITQKYIDIVCVDDLGKEITPDGNTRRFNRLLAKNNLKKITFHEIRHSVCSLLVSNGVHMKEVQAFARHANYSTTADIYTHLGNESRLTSLNSISSSLHCN